MRLLAVFAHPDDEIGCVGTLRQHALRGDEIMLVWTTYGELASQFGKASCEEVRRVRQAHGAWVAQELGAQYRFFDMGDSRMLGSRAEALELARLYATFKPDGIITWSDDHLHPDHRATAKIATDAVTLARIPKILCEEGAAACSPHRAPVQIFQYASETSIYPAIHVDISEEIKFSLRIFRFYQEFYSWTYTSEQYLNKRAGYGREAGVAYAEKFRRRMAFAPAVPYLI